MREGAAERALATTPTAPVGVVTAEPLWEAPGVTGGVAAGVAAQGGAVTVGVAAGVDPPTPAPAAPATLATPATPAPAAPGSVDRDTSATLLGILKREQSLT